MSTLIWGTPNFPATDVDLAAAHAAGASEIIQVPNGKFIVGLNVVPDSIAAIEVTAAQFMAALSQQTYYQAVLTYVASLPVAEQNMFNRTGVFDQNDALIQALAPNIPLTPSQIGALFIAASGITV